MVGANAHFTLLLCPRGNPVVAEKGLPRIFQNLTPYFSKHRNLPPFHSQGKKKGGRRERERNTTAQQQQKTVISTPKDPPLVILLVEKALKATSRMRRLVRLSQIIRASEIRRQPRHHSMETNATNGESCQLPWAWGCPEDPAAAPVSQGPHLAGGPLQGAGHGAEQPPAEHRAEEHGDNTLLKHQRG